MIKKFEDIIANHNYVNNDVIIAMANPVDSHSIQAAVTVKEEYDVDSILVGNEEIIIDLLNQYNSNNLPFRIVHAETAVEAGKEAVKLVREDQAQILMKGHLQTGDLIRPVLDRKTGLRDKEVLSHVALLDFPKYHKILGITDAGLNLQPDFDQKLQILDNALTLFHSLGYEKPKVGILEANEEVNQKMPTSVEAEKIMLMQQNGEIEGCVIDGPISADVALDKESADYKNYQSEVAGDADIILGSNITVLSALTKALVSFADARVTGLVMGAKNLIINNSRSTPVDEKVLSILIAIAIYQGEKR